MTSRQRIGVMILAVFLLATLTMGCIEFSVDGCEYDPEATHDASIMDEAKLHATATTEAKSDE